MLFIILTIGKYSIEEAFSNLVKFKHVIVYIRKCRNYRFIIAFDYSVE